MDEDEVELESFEKSKLEKEVEINESKRSLRKVLGQGRASSHGDSNNNQNYF